MEKRTLGISYGILSPKLSVQLDKQGYKYDKEIIKRFQRNIDSINDLRFSDLITDSVLNKILQKLHKEITKHVNKHNK